MKRKLFVIAALVVLLVAALSAIPATFANSALMYWEGVTSTGALVMDENCPLVVNSEKLVFDIPHFPEDYYSSSDEKWDNYDAKVSATYEFENPTDYEVTARLAFPFGTTFDYSADALYLSDRYFVTVDGEQVGKKVRYSFVNDIWSGSFSAQGAVSALKDERTGSGRINENATVLKVRYKASGAPCQQYELRFKIPDRDDVCVIAPPYNYCRIDSERVEEFGLFVKNGYWYDFAIVYTGEEPEFVLSAIKDDKEVDCEITRNVIGKTTLSGYADENYPFDDESESAKTDWFNIVVDYLSGSQGLATSFDGSGSGLFVERHVMYWYEYDLVVPAGETVVNTVTAPLLPDINKMYSPNIYKYEYLLSPAKVWAEFGRLDIQINTPYYVLDAEEKGFVKTEKGYSASFDALPDGELTFEVSESADPRYSDPYDRLFTLIIVTGIAVLLGAIEILLIISFAVKGAKIRNLSETDCGKRKDNTLRAAGAGFISCAAAGATLCIPSLLLTSGMQGLALAITAATAFFALSVAITVTAVKLLVGKKKKGDIGLSADSDNIDLNE